MGIKDKFNKRLHHLFFVFVQVIVAAPGTGDLFEKVPRIGKDCRTRPLPNSVTVSSIEPRFSIPQLIIVVFKLN